MIFALHGALAVSNMENSLRFYRDLMQMEVLRELEITDDRMDRLLSESDVTCRIVHLVAGQATLELFQYSQPGGKNQARQMKQYDQGIIHLGFEVTDFHERVARLRKEKVEFVGEPVEFRPGVWVVYLRGPDGEVCELRQQPQ